MHITAVICTRERYDLVGDAIESLLAQKDISAFDVIVVDNSPDRQRAEEFAHRYRDHAGLQFIFEMTPGLSNARNVGARAAVGDIVAYIDDDAVASDTWARALLHAFTTFGDKAGVVGGPIRPIWGGGPPPKWLGKRSRDMLSLVDRGTDLRRMEPHEWLAGCNIAFVRDALLDAGGFSLDLGRTELNNFLLANEEYVVCEKLMRSGYTMVYAPDALVDHRIPAHRATADWVVKRMAWQAISDAVSHPERSAIHAQCAEDDLTPWTKIKQTLKFMWIMSGWKRGVNDEELELVYDKFNHIICGDV